MSQQWPGQKVGTAPAAQPAPQAPAPRPTLRPVLSLPDPKGEREEARDETRLGLSIDERERGLAKDKFDRITTYRKEFLTEPMVREFRGVQNATNQILELAKRDSDQPGPGDIALIISFMKALDPGSVVRETEFATAENAGGVPETVRNAYNKLLTGGRLTPEIKQEFARTATTFYNARIGGYNTFAQDYRGLIEREGEDPDAQGVRLAEPIEFGGAATGAGASSQPVTVEQSAAAWGDGPKFDANGNPILPGGKGSPGFDGGVYDADGNFLFMTGTVTDESPDPRVSQAADALEAQLGEAGLMQLATQGITLGLSDEGGAIGTTIAQMLGGDFNVGDNYNFNVDVERELLRRARERTGGYGTAAELVGGGGAVRTVGNMAMNAGRAVAARGAPVNRAAIQGQMARQAGAEGAGIGAAAGFGYGEGAEESALGAGAGAAGGYLLARGGGALSNRAANRGRGSGGGGGGGPQGLTPGGQVVQAADNFNAATGANVQPLPADTGGAITRRASGAVAQTTFGARPIVEGAQAMNEQARAGIRTLAGRQGNVPQSRQAGGEVAISGAQKAIKRTGLKVDALYAKARKEAGDARVPLPFAKTTAQQEIATLADTPGGVDPSAKLREIVGDLEGEYTVDGIRRFRKTLRDKLISDNLRGSEVEAAAMRIVDAAEMDIEDGLVALGKPVAAKAYADAARAAAERFTLIDDVLAPVLGKRGEKSGEQVFAAIDQLSRGDAVTLGKFMRALPEEEAGSVRGLIIDRLGRASKGRQDADGQAFSLNDFLTRWNDEGLSKEAKAVLFDGETIAALDDLARVAQGTKEGQRFANFSNTGGAVWFNYLLQGAPFGALASGVLPAAGAAAVSTGAQFGLGRLLASPRFARWLAKMPKQATPAAARKHIMGLERIAAADSAIATDALGLQRQLLTAFDQGALPVAAQDQSSGSNTTGSETQ